MANFFAIFVAFLFFSKSTALSGLSDNLIPSLRAESDFLPLFFLSVDYLTRLMTDFFELSLLSLFES